LSRKPASRSNSPSCAKGSTKHVNHFFDKFSQVFGAGRKIDDTLLEEIEEILYTSDIGVTTTDDIITRLKERVRKDNAEDAADVYKLLKQIIHEMLIKSPSADADKSYEVAAENRPHTILIIGVNGVGKTTTIGKLAYNYKTNGKKVIIGAADTFRAAANEQLEIWAQRAGVDIIGSEQGTDPGAVVFRTMQKAVNEKSDVVIIDTAGRLHNKGNLMQELSKLGRVMKKHKEAAPDDVYLVLDATTGQNAIIQAKEFMKVAPITGIVLTKLDGTAKGGVVIPIANELKIPVRYIGVGEKIDDLQPFDPDYFVEAMFGIEEED
jgi:fused signal recognition particle receptor